MGTGLLLSDRDAKRLQDMLRWYEHDGRRPKYRRRGSGGGAGGTSFSVSWGKIIRGLKYADPDYEEAPDGYGQYIVRLLDSSYSQWSISHGIYSVGDLVLYDAPVEGDEDRVYQCILEHQSATGKEPDNETYWTIQDELQPKAIASQATYPVTDMRDYSRWFQVDDIVPLISRIENEVTVWYFWQTLTPLGNDVTGQSLRWNEDDNRLMAVFR